jgi:hypothetical protein
LDGFPAAVVLLIPAGASHPTGGGKMKRQHLSNIVLTATLLISLAVLLDFCLVRGSRAAEVSFSGKHQLRYTMNAGVRIIPFFWINRSNVGGGKVSWGEEADGTKVLSLLLGSDPERVWRKINRWGYIVERVSGSTAELTGIMTQSDEQSIDQAKASTAKSANRYAFKGIRSRLEGAEAQSTTFRMDVSKNYTYRDVDILLGQLPVTGTSVRHLQIPAGTDSGFLFAVRSMLQETAEKFKSTGKPTLPKPRQYVYSARLYKLFMPESRIIKRLSANGHEYKQLIESEFEAHNSATKEVSHFVITYGTEAPFSEIPIKIVYQPRWWFRAELLLDESAGIPLAAVSW